MTKTVFDNAMTAHVWAQQSQDSGRSNNGNMYFEGQTIYSYGSHFPMGYAMKSGQFILNSDSYSPSTGKHQNYVMYAIPSQRETFSASNLAQLINSMGHVASLKRYFADIEKTFSADLPELLLHDAGMTPSKAKTWVESNVKRRKVTMINRANKRAGDLLKEQLRNAKRFAVYDSVRIETIADKWNSELALNNLSKNMFHAIKAAKKRGWKTIASKVTKNRAIVRELINLEKRRNEIVINRASLKDAIAKIRGEWPLTAYDAFQCVSKCNVILNQTPLRFPAMVELRDKLTVEHDRLRKEENAARVERDKEKRVEWYVSGGYAYGLCCESGGVCLRAHNVERDETGAISGGELQTSQGAKVPLTHAIKVFRAVKRCKDRGVSWQRNGETIRVGHFQVDSIEPNGDFVAGCHNINWPEIAKLAEYLGVE